MRKILIDFNIPDSKKAAQDYLAERFGFGADYGRNLDALYDELTSIAEATAVGIYMPDGDPDDLDFELLMYFDKICQVFSDAEKSNPSLAVIFGDIMMDPGYEFPAAEDLIDDYTGEAVQFTDVLGRGWDFEASMSEEPREDEFPDETEADENVIRHRGRYPYSVSSESAPSDEDFDDDEEDDPDGEEAGSYEMPGEHDILYIDLDRK